MVLELAYITECGGDLEKGEWVDVMSLKVLEERESIPAEAKAGSFLVRVPDPIEYRRRKHILASAQAHLQRDWDRATSEELQSRIDRVVLESIGDVHGVSRKPY